MLATMSLSTARACGALLILICAAQYALGQEAGRGRRGRTVSGAATVTNNGISLLPTFTLGKPAAILDMSVRGRRLSFEPQLRLALEGKPWAFIFWWRYRLATTAGFSIRVGAHPALMFLTEPPATAGGSETMVVRRYVAAEVAPSYALGNGVSVGMYYLFGRGLEDEGPQNTHFLTVNARVATLRLTEPVFLRLTPSSTTCAWTTPEDTTPPRRFLCTTATSRWPWSRS